MPVCLHCGELNSEGALFCTKCGYTLPQADPGGVGNSPPPGPATPTTGPGFAPPPTAVSPPPPPTGLRPTGIPGVYAPAGYAVLAPPVPGAVGPIPPPPNGKYCIRCRTVISRAAVFCPVCQQPQS